MIFRKTFPFFVQIAPFKYNEGSYANFLREQQAKTAQYDNTYMVVISDLVEDVSNIHPLNKWDVGIRLANQALTHTYKRAGFIHQYPRLDRVEIKKDKAYLSFIDSPGIMVKGNKVDALKVAGADGVFKDAESKIKDGKLIVWNNTIKDIRYVRYAFENDAIGNLFSIEGLPVVPFRTDNLPAY